MAWNAHPSEIVDHENEARSISTDAFTLSLLERSESFICGFEGDDDQDGIDEPEEQALKKIAQALQLSLDAYL